MRTHRYWHPSNPARNLARAGLGRLLKNWLDSRFAGSGADIPYSSNVPTHDCNIFDLVLCNNPYLINSGAVVEPFSNSDHSMVNFQLFLKFHECIVTEIFPVYDYVRPILMPYIQYLVP